MQNHFMVCTLFHQLFSALGAVSKLLPRRQNDPFVNLFLGHFSSKSAIYALTWIQRKNSYCISQHTGQYTRIGYIEPTLTIRK